MLKLSRMQRVVSTLTDDRESPLADTIAARWAHDPGSVRYFRSSSNYVFTFRQDGRLCWLRFIDAQERSRLAIEAELGVLYYLDQTLVRAARPIPSLMHRDVETVETTLDRYHAVAFEHLAGEQLQLEQLIPQQFEQWGAALGRLHQALRGVAQDLRAGRPTSQSLLAAAQEFLPPSERAAHAELARALDWIEGLETGSETYGLIHYDFELDNLRWENGLPGALDFDDCANHWYAADVASALRDVIGHGSSVPELEDPRVAWFLAGYRGQAGVEVALGSTIPRFLRIQALLGFADLLRAVGDQEVPALGGLRQRLLGIIGRNRKGFAASVF